MKERESERTKEKTHTETQQSIISKSIKHASNAPALICACDPGREIDLSERVRFCELGRFVIESGDPRLVRGECGGVWRGEGV